MKGADQMLDPDGGIENSGKSIFEIWIPHFCCLQVIVFDLGYQPVAAVAYLLNPNRYNWQIAKVKNYNLNVTEVLDST